MPRSTSILLLFAIGLAGCAAGGFPAAGTLRATQVRGQSPVLNSAPAASKTPDGKPKEARPLLLRDVICEALKHSSVILTLNGDVTLTGVTNLDPQIAAAAIGQEEGMFNPKLSTGLAGNWVERPPNSYFGPGISSSNRYDDATFYARLAQPLTTGGEASVNYDPSTGYFYLPNGVSPGRFNPAYSADFVFRLKQPVFRNGGANRVLTPIRVARAKTDQSNWDVQSALNSEIRSLSEAYWNLLAARIRLQAIDSVLPLANESIRLEQLRLQSEQVIQADVARAEVQVEVLVRARATAVQECRRRNYQLDQLMGLPLAEAGEIIPIDLPVREFVPADAASMSSVAIQRLPELAKLRKQLEIRALQLNVAYKDRLPDVNLLGEYRTSGLASNIGDALHQSASLGFPTWKYGVTLDYPLGNTTARSRAAAAEMELERDRLILKASEDRAGYNIAKLIAGLEAAWERHESADRQVRQSHEWLRLSGIRYRDPMPAPRGGNSVLLALVDYQNAMKGYVDALTAAAETLAEYNVALARLDEAQGISMERWAVVLADDVWPSVGVDRPLAGSTTEIPNKHSGDLNSLKTAHVPRPAASSHTQPVTWQGHSSYRDRHTEHGVSR